MGIVKSILKNHYGLKISRNWDKTYWAFDIHGTILKPNIHMVIYQMNSIH
jgi:hypothetical protein